MKKVKVLHIVYAMGMGGAETWIMQLIRFWSEQKSNLISIDILVTSGIPSLFDQEARSLGTVIYYLPLNKNTISSFIVGFRKILKTNKYSAIHDHQDLLAGWHFLFVKFLLPPVRVVHFHNPHYQLSENYGKSRRRRILSFLGRKLLSIFATHIAGTSQQILKDYDIIPEKFPKQSVGALHCAFSINNWPTDHPENKSKLCNELGWPITCKVILFAGRLDYSLEINHPQNHKNSAFALEVIKLSQQYGDIRMIMAGANDYIAEDFQNLIDKYQLTCKVKMLGIRTDIKHLMVASDLLFFPSRAEGLGMVAVESQCAGLPVLASSAVPTEIKVIDELVYFVDLTESKGFWAKAINKILGNPRPSPTFSDSRWCNSQFNIEVSSKILEQIYNRN